MKKRTPIVSSRELWHGVASACLAVLLAISWAPPAAAQLSRVGENPSLGVWPVRGTDVAYDPVNNVYLVIGSTAGDNITPLLGVFANGSGTPITAPFQINTPGLLAHFPRVTYSPHVSNGAGGFGGFLVTWHATNPVPPYPNAVRARVVAFPNRLVGSENEIPSSTFQEAGPNVAYSSASQVFLVVWQASNFTVWAAALNTNAQLVGGPVQISEPGGGARDPSVAWNSHTNEFGVVYTGWGSSGATTAFARVSVGGAVLRRNTFNFAVGTYITGLAFNSATGRWVAAWYQGGSYGAEIDANGDVVAQGLLSIATGAYDGMGLAYNPASGTFLLVGQGPTLNVWAVELNSRGARTSADTEVTFAGGPLGSYYPRTTASTGGGGWNLSFAHNLNTVRDQVVQTSSSGGGPAGSLGTPSGGGGTTSPSPTPTTSGGCTTPDPFTATGGGTCVNGGWVPGGSTSGGTTSGGCTTPSPGTGWTCVNGGWVPSTTSSSSTSGGCTTPDPFVAMGGGTCISGGWVPGGSTSGGTTSGGCTTPSPGTGWTCVNGGWVPSTTSSSSTSGGCTSPDPFVAMGGGTCINGGWVPATSSCTTPSPGPGWTCVNGGWLPPDVSGGGGGSTSGGCTTPDPFTAIGGGVCINGGWVPRSS